METMRLRLGAYEHLNDLREARQNAPSLSVPDASAIGARYMEIAAQADLWMRRYVRIGCFTRDFEGPSPFMDPDATRGWAHPALWAHYGRNHSGVCLEFDRPRLIQQMSAQLSDRGRLITGDVSYDVDAFPKAAGLDYEQIEEFGLDAAVWAYLYQDRDYLLFTKHTDWSNEQEFRLLCLGRSAEPVELDVSDCLTGVYFGDSFGRQLAAEARRVAAERPDVASFVLHHFNRRLMAMPGTPTSSEPTLWPSGLGDLIEPRSTGSLFERVQALERAQRAADDAAVLGRSVSASLLTDWGQRMGALRRELEVRTGQEFRLDSVSTAVPPGRRMRAPGVEHEIQFQGGWLVTAWVSLGEHTVHAYSASIAVQLLVSGAVRWFGGVTREQLDLAEQLQLSIWQHEASVVSINDLDGQQTFAELRSAALGSLELFAGPLARIQQSRAGQSQVCPTCSRALEPVILEDHVEWRCDEHGEAELP